MAPILPSAKTPGRTKVVKADIPPTMRTRRTRACKTVAAQTIKKSLTNKASPVMLQSSAVGINSSNFIKVENNFLSRKMSSERVSAGSVCVVAVEKLPLQDFTITSDIKQPSIAKESAIEIKMETSPSSEVFSPGPAVVGSPKALSPVVQLTTTPEGSGLSDDVELSLAKPTPPRRKALKLRKKGGKKVVRPSRTRAAELKVEAKGKPVAFYFVLQSCTKGLCGVELASFPSHFFF